MDANEQKARELLAAEYERDGQTLVASHIRNGSYEYIRAIRAIMAALAQQVPADGEWVPETELLALVAGPYMYHHKMDDAAMREARAFDRCRELTIQNIQTWCAMRRAMLAATPQAPQPVVDAPSVADSKAMGAKGGPSNEAERLAFEAWMHGHCWALCATWDGAGYRGDAEQSGRYCPDAARTRGLWAAWRDRAALAASQPQQGAVEAARPTLTDCSKALDAAVDDAELAEFVRGIYQRMNESYEGGRRILFQDMDYLFDFATKRRIILSQVRAALAAHGKPND